MSDQAYARVFDYRTTRILIGATALMLPIWVVMISDVRLPSISAYYYTNARDVFVGSLFFVGTFLLAYRGRDREKRTLEPLLSKLAGIAAMTIALIPTSCLITPLTEKTGCDIYHSHPDVHVAAAFILFSTLAWFCLVPFLSQVKNRSGKAKRRAVIYRVCGWTIIAMLLIGVVTPAELKERYDLTFFIETIALSAFGIAWLVAGKWNRLIADEEDLHQLFTIKNKT